ncbi:MAG: dihydropteroate synthase [Chitinophagaceae bacterium]|nr:dihydropteroate synthase [Chitinophagaceae bacterium]
MYTINCKGKLLVIDEPLVMGIINATPDSFYEGHLGKGITAITALASSMLADGATILDIGGQSTRPGSIRVSVDEELKRVVPVIEGLLKEHPDAIISIDTYYSKVAMEAVNAGASIINDISAGSMDNNMLPVAAALKVPYIAMHMQGSPETMQQQPVYENVTTEVLDFFIKKVEACKQAGLVDVIIDPGFGFGKTIQHNFQLLKNLGVFNMLDRPVLAGLSRKGTVYKTLGIAAGEALNGTTSLNTIALMNGAHILRVHDVKEAMQAVTLWKAYQNA